MQKRKRFYVALAIYAVLGLLIWITMTDVPVPMPAGISGEGRSLVWIKGHLGMRSLALIVLGGFVLRTVLHWRADQIRGEQDEDEEEKASR
jgi:uncharacterized protein involved in response to NO